MNSELKKGIYYGIVITLSILTTHYLAYYMGRQSAFTHAQWKVIDECQNILSMEKKTQ